jgi:hypothetical protein
LVFEEARREPTRGALPAEATSPLSGPPLDQGRIRTERFSGKIVLVVDGFAIRQIDGIPKTISTEITGQEMEAICRINGMIGIEDFLERMALCDKRGTFLNFPFTKSALDQHRERVRIMIKCIPWQLLC